MKNYFDRMFDSGRDLIRPDGSLRVTDQEVPSYKIRQYRQIPGLTVWIVNGNEVRTSVNIDFALGGHGYVKSASIPQDEIWIEISAIEEEYYFIYAHELYERWLMKSKSMDYDQAHEIANSFETQIRAHPEEFSQKMATLEENV